MILDEYSINLPSKPRAVKENETSAVYEIDGLYPGYGYTLGNILRRVILSSIPGTAITSVKIDGVSHEFTTIKGVKEEVLIILLNLKRILFKLHTNEPQKVKIKKKGVGFITAGDISNNPQVEVVNKDHNIAEITDPKVEFSAELTIERGVGFVQRDSHKDRVEIGTIVIDSFFSPIRRVNYEVEPMRVGDRIDFNRLRVFIETDGTITPKEVFRRTVSIAITQLQAIVGFKDDLESEEIKMTEKELEAERGTVDQLGLKNRVTNALKKAGIVSLNHLEEKTRKELADIPGLGDRAIDEIEMVLAERGLSIRKADK